MTREEAIEVLKANYPSKCFEQLCEAVEMAIKALEQEPSVQPCEDCDYSEIMDWEQDTKTGKAKPIYWCERHKEPCDDAISRQAAIDSLNKYFAKIGKLKRRGLNKGEKAISLDTIGVIETLPPVTPQPCDDAISRQKAIDIIDALYLDGDSSASYRASSEGDALIGKYQAITALDDLPPITPQPKTGHWISVSERLPEKNVEVLVTTEWDGITIGEMFSNNDWFIHEGATNADIDDIKAWMPLPKSYVPDTNIGKMSEIPTGCSNSSCENCKYSDGDCCRLIYEVFNRSACL